MTKSSNNNNNYIFNFFKIPYIKFLSFSSLLSFFLLISSNFLTTTTDCSPVHHIRHEFHKTKQIDLANIKNLTSLSTNSNLSRVELKKKNALNEILETQKLRTPPSYLSFMYETLALNSKSNDYHQFAYSTSGENSREEEVFQNKKAPILRAILSTQITNTKKSTLISFSLNKKSIGDFNRANIILTLKDEINLSDEGSSVNIFVNIKNYQIKQSLTIREESKFYSFDITKILKNKIQEFLDSSNSNEEETLDHDNSNNNNELEIFTIECTISQNIPSRKLQFQQIFDIDHEAPFILLRFQQINFSTGIIQSNNNYYESLKNEENWIIHHHSKHRRNKRSIGTAAVAANRNSLIQMPLDCLCPNHTLFSSSSTPNTINHIRQLKSSSTLPPPKNNPIYNFIINDTDNNQKPLNNKPADDEYEITSGSSSPLSTSVSDNSNNNGADDQISSLTTPEIESESEDGEPMNSISLRTQSKLLIKQPYPSLIPPIPTVCRRHEWLVKPSDISLDDVVRPEYLDLGYCSGTCPFPLENDVYNFTLHSYFVDQHRFFKGFGSPINLPQSTCIPVTYKKLMVMVKEPDGGFMVIVFDDASVESCGCR